MASAMAPSKPTNLCTVVIQGLQKAKDVEQDGWQATVDEDSGLFKVSTTFGEYEPLDALWKRIQGNLVYYTAIMCRLNRE